MECALRIVREDCRVQAIDALICELDSLIFIVGWDDADDRSEDLLSCDRRGVLDITEHGGLDVEAPLQMARATATCDERSALRQALGDISLDAVALPRHPERSHVGLGIEGIADSDLLECRAKRLDERIMTRACHDHARQGRADLPRENGCCSRQ